MRCKIDLRETGRGEKKEILWLGLIIYYMVLPAQCTPEFGALSKKKAQSHCCPPTPQTRAYLDDAQSRIRAHYGATRAIRSIGFYGVE